MNVLTLDEVSNNGIIKKRVIIGLKTRKKIISDLKNNVYTHIRGYHGCRPVDIESYKVLGICPMTNIFEVRKNAIEIFNVSEAQILSVELEPDAFSFREGKVFFTMYEFDLTKYCGHYLCYGSEYLLCLVGGLDNSTVGKYHNILLNRGTPTILGVNIPFCQLSEVEKDNLYSALLENASMENITIEVHDVVHGENIVSVNHPNIICDVITWRKYEQIGVNKRYVHGAKWS
jgi:hypothetical protein